MEMGETLSGGPNQNSNFCLSHLVAWIGNEKEREKKTFIFGNKKEKRKKIK